MTIRPKSPKAKYQTTCKTCGQILIRTQDGNLYHGRVEIVTNDVARFVGWTDECDPYFIHHEYQLTLADIELRAVVDEGN